MSGETRKMAVEALERAIQRGAAVAESATRNNIDAATEDVARWQVLLLVVLAELSMAQMRYLIALERERDDMRTIVRDHRSRTAAERYGC